MKIESVSAFLDMSFSTGMDEAEEDPVRRFRETQWKEDETSTHSSSSVSAEEDEDEMGSLDGKIPSMAAYYEAEEEIEETTPCIGYLGREYAIDVFKNSNRVFQASSIAQAPPRRIRQSSSERTLSASDTVNANSSASNNTNSISQSEYWGASRFASVQSTLSETVSTARQATYRKASALLRRASTSIPSSITSTATAPATTNSLSSQSEHFASTRRVPGSYTSGNCKPMLNLSDQAANATTSTRRYILSKIGLPKSKQEQNWEQITKKWGYTNHDVLNLVENDQLFAKLQHDLRCVNAITNSLVQQRIHVFVHNTNKRQNQTESTTPTSKQTN